MTSLAKAAPGRLSAVSILVIIAAAFLTYSNSFHNGFHLDDVAVLLENAAIKDLGSLPLLLKEQRGVSMATFALNYAWGGFDVFGYHFVSVSLHALTGVLVFILMVKTLALAEFSDDRRRIVVLSTFIALLFTVHPVQTQAVNYISQRMEILASFFFVAGLVFFVKGALSRATLASISLFILAFASFWLGLYSKEIAVTLPIIMLAYDYYFIAKGRLRCLVARLPVHTAFFAFALYFSYKVLVTLGGIGSAEKIAAALPQGESTVGFSVMAMTWWEYLLTQFNVLVYYVYLCFIPINLNLLYDFPISRRLFEFPTVNEGAVLNYPPPPPIVSLAIIFLIIFASFIFYRAAVRSNSGLYKVTSFFIVWFFILLLPTSSFVPIADVIFEHRLYLSLAGYAVILVLWVDELCRKSASKTDTSANHRCSGLP